MFAFFTIAGDQDLICNWLGNRRWVDGLEWSGSQGWSQAQDKPWKVDGKQAGEVTQFDTLSFVKIYGAVSGDSRGGTGSCGALLSVQAGAGIVSVFAASVCCDWLQSQCECRISKPSS